MKVLIVSHNCFSTTQSMGKTFSSLFSTFEQDELMQLYLYPTLPNTDKCTNLFRITDQDVINCIIHRSGSCGRVICPTEIKPENTLYDNSSNTNIYCKRKRMEFVARRGRDLLWTLGSWKSATLKKWLQEGKPDVVFYALGDAIFSQNIAMWVADFLNIPLVTYVCDEFYYYNQNLHNPFSRAICASLVKNIKKTIKRSAHLITICEEQGRVYQKEFGVSYTTIMTGSSFPAGSLMIDDSSKQISYIGNLALNRWKSMREIAIAVKQFNEKLGKNYRLVYYGTKNEYMDGYAEFGGRLNPQEVQEVMRKSRLLIHTESFEEEFRDRLRYSVSTKVADSLASGNCLFAYGSYELASFHYLKENECAFVCNTQETLYNVLVDALENETHRQKIKTEAVKTANRNHNSLNNSEKLKEVFKLVWE